MKKTKNLKQLFKQWEEMLQKSFLSENMKKRYLNLIQERWKRLN